MVQAVWSGAGDEAFEGLRRYVWEPTRANSAASCSSRCAPGPKAARAGPCPYIERWWAAPDLRLTGCGVIFRGGQFLNVRFTGTSRAPRARLLICLTEVAEAMGSATPDCAATQASAISASAAPVMSENSIGADFSRFPQVTLLKQPVAGGGYRPKVA